MNRKHISIFLFNLLIIVLLLILANCSNTSIDSTIKEGHYVGTTSQGMQIELWIKKVEGQFQINKIRYTINLSNSSGELVTQFWSEPSDRAIPIQKNTFSGETTFGDLNESLSGSISRNTLHGELTLSMNHPQIGMEKVTGTITFSAEFSEAGSDT